MQRLSPTSTVQPNPFQHGRNDVFVNVSAEMRDEALKRTSDVLWELDKIRKSLELPIEQLPIVIETYSQAVLALVAEAAHAERAKHTKRVPITMRSENREYQPMKLAPGEKFDVITRPQEISFTPEDFTIHGDRKRWLVHDVKIGNRSQFASHRGPAPGTEFGPGGLLEHMRLETVRTAMDLVLVVEYIGPEPEGEVFEATVVGTVMVL